MKFPHPQMAPAAQVYRPSAPQDNLGWQWVNPSQENIVTNFCLDTSLHGLPYLGQQKRHIFERVFWLAAFIASTATATIFIWQMWSAYVDMPIVTVFQPQETTIDEIPFPGITICNVNNIKKSKVVEYMANTLKTQSNEDRLRASAKVLDVKHICDSTQTFSQIFLPNDTLQSIFNDFERNITSTVKEFDVEKYLNTTATLREATQSCSDMILFWYVYRHPQRQPQNLVLDELANCLWLDEPRNCKDLFQPIETDYGYCCTFNSIPMSLLMKFKDDIRDKADRVDLWNRSHVEYDTLLFTEETKDRSVPWRQQYPGRSAGLSILLDPDLDEYFCTNTDSKGFVISLHVPIDIPRMRDNGKAISVSSEVFIGVRPEITIADKTAADFPLEKRGCYFGGEFNLQYFTKYTSGNCLDECIAEKTLATCNCTRYYMPHGENPIFCRPDKYVCSDEVYSNIIQKGLEGACNDCLPTCTEIQYQTETTTLPTLDNNIKHLFKSVPKPWFDLFGKEDTKSKQVSIVHIYFNVDSTYPRLRKEVTNTINLISNAGGLLGLCMGFSMLSLLEVIYYFTVRVIFNYYREWTVERQRKKSLAFARIFENGGRADLNAYAKAQEWLSKMHRRPTLVHHFNEFGNGAPPNNNYPWNHYIRR